MKKSATLNITAFIKEDRSIRLMFIHGEIYTSLKENTIYIKRVIDAKDIVIKFEKDNCDEKLIKDFIDEIKNRNLKMNFGTNFVK